MRAGDRPLAVTELVGGRRSRFSEGKMGDMDVLSSRTLLRPSEPSRSHRFYRDTLGLAIYREFGSPDAPVWVPETRHMCRDLGLCEVVGLA